jgi:hypothetical protein
MASEHANQQDGSFVVRIWWEHGEQETMRWRGWIQHVRKGTHRSFQTMAEMISFIERETGMQPTIGEVSPGLI